MANPPAKNSLWNWLGRQVGYVGGAVLSNPNAKHSPKATSSPPPEPAPSRPQAAPQQPQVIYRDGRVEEVDHPTQPGVKLRRTIIDEVVVDEPPPQ